MLRRRAKQSTGGTREPKIAFDHGHATAIPAPPLASPPQLLWAASSDISPEPSETIASPTSTLHTAASPTSPAATCGGGTAVPFSRGGSGDRGSRSHRSWDATPVGLGLVSALNGEAPDDVVASAVLTGQKLRVQTNFAPCSPSREFGVKSRCGADRLVQQDSPRRRALSPREMEMSEDYTRVIARRPNPRTTHIFDNCVVESRGGFGFGFSGERATAASGRKDFLSYCHSCSKDLGQGKDIFMYRGETAFCSHECRYHEMLSDEGRENF